MLFPLSQMSLMQGSKIARRDKISSQMSSIWHGGFTAARRFSNSINYTEFIDFEIRRTAAADTPCCRSLVQ